MKPEKTLLPIDVARCPVDAFEVVNRLAQRAEVSVVLLHVVNLRIMVSEDRVYQELACEAEWYLTRLAERYLNPTTRAMAHVRIGDPAREILEEANAECVDLVILPTYGPSFWDRWIGLWRPASQRTVSRLVAKVTKAAPCTVLVVPATTHLDCEMAWGRPAKLNETSQWRDLGDGGVVAEERSARARAE